MSTPQPCWGPALSTLLESPMCALWPGSWDSQGPCHTGEVAVPGGSGPGNGRPAGRWSSVLLVASAPSPPRQPDGLTPALRGGLH